MAFSVFPDEASAAGVVYRDAAGAPINPPDVHNAYPPLPPFLSTCLITALPSNCDARIEPRQINAIVSELLSFAECLDPNGTWDCNSLRNLCAAFTAWATENVCKLVVADTPPLAPCPNQLWWESDTSVLWLWYDDGNSIQWVQVNGIANASSIHVGDTPPPNPNPNMLWWESDTGNLYLWYNDGNSTQWVHINPTPVNATVVDNISIVGAGVAGNPLAVSLVDGGIW